MSSSYRYNIFTLRAYLCWRHTYCQWPIIELAKNVSSKNKTAASHVVQIHMHARFPWRKKWPTYHVAIPTGNALALQRSIFKENHLNFRPSFAAEKVSIVCGTNNHVKSEMLSNRHTDRQTKYCNPRCACTPRVKNIGGPPPIPLPPFPLPHFAHVPQPQIAGFNSQYVAAIHDTRLPNTTFFRTYHKENIP